MREHLNQKLSKDEEGADQKPEFIDMFAVGVMEELKTELGLTEEQLRIYDATATEKLIKTNIVPLIKTVEVATAKGLFAVWREKGVPATTGFNAIKIEDVPPADASDEQVLTAFIKLYRNKASFDSRGLGQTVGERLRTDWQRKQEMIRDEKIMALQTAVVQDDASLKGKINQLAAEVTQVTTEKESEIAALKAVHITELAAEKVKGDTEGEQRTILEGREVRKTISHYVVDIAQAQRPLTTPDAGTKTPYEITYGKTYELLNALKGQLGTGISTEIKNLPLLAARIAKAAQLGFPDLNKALNALDTSKTLSLDLLSASDKRLLVTWLIPDLQELPAISD